MPTKVSERNLLGSLAFLAIAFSFLFNAKLFTAPVTISEKGIVFIVLGLAAIAFSIRYFKKVITKA